MSEHAFELAELMPDKAIAPRQGIGINVRRLLRLRGPIMAALFGPGICIALVLIWMLVPKNYIAVGSVKFKAISQPILGGEGRTLTGSGYEMFVNTQIKMITGPAFIDEVLKDPELHEKASHITRVENARGHILAHLESEEVPRTEIVQFSYRDPDRDTAVLVMDTILRTYEAYLRREVQERGGLARTTLEQRLASLTQELDADMKRIAQERESRGISAGEIPGKEPVETEAIRINLSQAEADLTRAEVSADQTQKLRDEIDRLLGEFEANPAKPVYALGVEDRIIEHPSVTFLSEQLAAVQQEFAALEDRYVEGAPQVKVKERELEALQAKLDAARAEARGDALRSVAAQYAYDLERAQSEIEEARARRDKFRAAITDYDALSVKRSEGMAVIEDMQRQASEKRARVDQIQRELFRIDLESNAPAQVTPDAKSWADTSADYTDRIKYAAVATFAFFLFSLGLGIVLETRDQNIRSGEDVAFVTKHPVLATVPHAVEDRLPDNTAIGRVAADYPDSFTADELRRTAARVLTAPGGGEIRTCMVASPSRGDGKTVLACNLAIVLAQAGRRVLLVDVNSHAPGVEQNFNLRPSVGLGELLGGEPLQHDPDQATDFQNLFVLGPGLNSRDLLSRMASRAMRDFLAGAEEVFDHVIIDTPATLLMSEARLLAPVVDGVVVVVGAGVSTFGMVRRCLRTLEDTGGRVLGVALNGLRQSPFGYLKHNLSMYYDERRGHSRHTVVPGPAAPRARAQAEQSIILLKEGSKARRDV